MNKTIHLTNIKMVTSNSGSGGIYDLLAKPSLLQQHMPTQHHTPGQAGYRCGVTLRWSTTLTRAVNKVTLSDPAR